MATSQPPSLYILAPAPAVSFFLHKKNATKSNLDLPSPVRPSEPNPISSSVAMGRKFFVGGNWKCVRDFALLISAISRRSSVFSFLLKGGMDQRR